eukprot:gene5737-7126_t
MQATFIAVVAGGAGGGWPGGRGHSAAAGRARRPRPRSHCHSARCAEGGGMTAATSITVRVPLEIRHRRGRKTVVTPMADGAAPITTRADPALVKALARAFRYQRMLDEGRYASITEMAYAERIERGYLGSLLRLTLLAPDIVDSVLNGQAGELGLPALLGPFPMTWTGQRSAMPASARGQPDMAD